MRFLHLRAIRTKGEAGAGVMLVQITRQARWNSKVLRQSRDTGKRVKVQDDCIQFQCIRIYK